MRRLTLVTATLRPLRTVTRAILRGRPVRRALCAALALLLTSATFAAARPANRFTLSDDGLGPLTRDVEVTVDDVRTAYPEFSIELEPYLADGAAGDRIIAREGQGLVFTVDLDQGRFRDITVYSSLIEDDAGVRIGDPFEDLPIRSRRLCVLSAGGAPYVACPSERSVRLVYLFDSAPNLPRANDPLTAIRIWQ